MHPEAKGQSTAQSEVSLPLLRMHRPHSLSERTSRPVELWRAIQLHGGALSSGRSSGERGAARAPRGSTWLESGNQELTLIYRVLNGVFLIASGRFKRSVA